MANYFISYDLMNQKNYPRVEAQIQAVDPSALRVLFSLWYVKSQSTQEQVYNSVVRALDNDDKLLVITSSTAIAEKSRLGPVWDATLKRWNS